MIPCRRRATHHRRVLQPLREMQLASSLCRILSVMGMPRPWAPAWQDAPATELPAGGNTLAGLRYAPYGLRPARIIAAEENEMMLGILRATAAAIVLAIAVVAAPAQNVADFYKGKNIELYIGYSVGGGYDLWARVLARHIGRHIPGNPTIVVKNMEGAGSLRLANWLYRIGPKDGSVFGIIGRGTGFDPLLGQQAAQFDSTKFTWIGS